MLEIESKPSSTSGNLVISTPLAIIIAGALVAVAVYFSNAGGGGSGAGLGDKQAGGEVGQPSAAPEAPKLAEVGPFREVDERDHVRGSEDAKITIIEYSDLECPFCKRFHATLTQVMADYPKDVRWVYRHFPLEQLHSKATAEANAAECAGEQGKFWEFVDLVFETTQGNDSLDLSTLPDLAAKAGVANASAFAECVESDKYAAVVAADVADAQSAGGQGTPYSVVIGPDGSKTAINGARPLAKVKATIESLLK